MEKKRILAVLAAMMIASCASACGKDNESEKTDNDIVISEDSEEDEAESTKTAKEDQEEKTDSENDKNDKSQNQRKLQKLQVIRTRIPQRQQL